MCVDSCVASQCEAMHSQIELRETSFSINFHSRFSVIFPHIDRENDICHIVVNVAGTTSQYQSSNYLDNFLA